jgi:hypothetical protein
MTAEFDERGGWSQFLETTLAGYLRTLDADPVAARAFIVEMDAAGAAARQRRREAVEGFAALLAERHAAMRATNPRLGPLPELAYRMIALGVRELVRDTLERHPVAVLQGLAPDLIATITATVNGARSALRWRTCSLSVSPSMFPRPATVL